MSMCKLLALRLGVRDYEPDYEPALTPEDYCSNLRAVTKAEMGVQLKVWGILWGISENH